MSNSKIERTVKKPVHERLDEIQQKISPLCPIYSGTQSSPVSSAAGATNEVNLLEIDESVFYSIVTEFRALFADSSTFGRSDIIKLSFLYMMFSSYIHHWAEDSRMKFGTAKLDAIKKGVNGGNSLDLIAMQYVQNKLKPALVVAREDDLKDSKTYVHQHLLMVNANLFEFVANVRKYNPNVAVTDLSLSLPENKIEISRQRAQKRSERTGQQNPQTQNNNNGSSYEKIVNGVLDKNSRRFTSLRVENAPYIELNTGLELDYPLQFNNLGAEQNGADITIELNGKSHYNTNSKTHNPLHNFKSRALLAAGLVTVPIDVSMGIDYTERTPLKPATIDLRYQNTSLSWQQPGNEDYINQHLKPKALSVATKLNTDFVHLYHTSFYKPLVKSRQYLRKRIINLQDQILKITQKELKDKYAAELNNLLKLDDDCTMLINKRVMEKLLSGAENSDNFQISYLSKLNLENTIKELSKQIEDETSNLEKFQKDIKANGDNMEKLLSSQKEILACLENEYNTDTETTVAEGPSKIIQLKNVMADMKKLGDSNSKTLKSSAECENNISIKSHNLKQIQIELTVLNNTEGSFIQAAEQFFSFKKIQDIINTVNRKILDSQSNFPDIAVKSEPSKRSSEYDDRSRFFPQGYKQYKYDYNNNNNNYRY